ncbi:hypothetical protein T11_15547 [Trichinella zimbabwensis]|uniref:Uncharacterized protein n=1 Tax=Trichinella zimbabwensis TaxID=268475 RepID=A0A0V1HMK9_9BILA|nr:hypothetical protein T11_15547 [Trichinella zimbabwensis]
MTTTGPGGQPLYKDPMGPARQDSPAGRDYKVLALDQGALETNIFNYRILNAGSQNTEHE